MGDRFGDKRVLVIVLIIFALSDICRGGRPECRGAACRSSCPGSEYGELPARDGSTAENGSRSRVVFRDRLARWDFGNRRRKCAW